MRKISLNELYNEQKKAPNPAKKFIADLAKATNRSELTVRLWINGHHVPEPLIIKEIANYLDVDPNSLFPNITTYDIK